MLTFIFSVSIVGHPVLVVQSSIALKIKQLLGPIYFVPFTKEPCLGLNMKTVYT